MVRSAVMQMHFECMVFQIMNEITLFAGDLTSSGYMSGSGMDDSSYDQSSTDSSRNWSVPVINGANKSDIKMSHSLPSRLEGPASKMLLGLAIVISLGDDSDDDDQESGRRYGSLIFLLFI